MKFKKSDVKIETKRGQGPGGQHRNKTDSCVTATHIPTGLSITIDGRKQGQNKKKAYKELEKLVSQKEAEERAANKKEQRDYKIHNTKIVRTYHYGRNEVKDHRSGKKAPLKKMMDGKVDLEEFSNE